MVFTDSFIGPLHKILNSQIQNCIYVKSIYSYSNHAAFSQALGDNNFSQAEKSVTKITERQSPQTSNSFRRPCTSFFFSDIYCMVTMKYRQGFAYSSIPVGFSAISMSFLSFLSQTIYPGEFLRPEGILNRSYLKQIQYLTGTPYHHQFVIF